jgi:DNA polymerase III delta prime subunit
LVAKKLLTICNLEKIIYEKDALNQLALVSNGDLRRAINFLQMIYNKNNIVSLEAVNNLCDLPQQIVIKKMIQYAINKNIRESLNILYELIEKGYSGSDITLGMMNTLKSDSCSDIPEKTKMQVMYHVSLGSHRISQGVDTLLQLASCIADIVNFD